PNPTPTPTSISPPGAESNAKLQISAHPLPGTPTSFNSRLHRTSLALLETVHRYGWGALGNYKKRVIHDCLVKREAYQDLYLVMRERHKGLVSSWKEVTDPYKHVFEDIGIATFLMLLWKDTYASPSSPVVDDEGDAEPWKKWPRPPGGFIDFGCGNGLLTHILVSEGYEGVGIDLRARTSWEHYPQASRDALRVCAFSPFDLVPEASSPSPSPRPDSSSSVPPPPSFDLTDSKDVSSPDASPASHPNDSPSSPDPTDDSKGADSSPLLSGSIFKPHAFIIANHADELTPWVPVVTTLTDASGEQTEAKREEGKEKENQAKDQEEKEEEENGEAFIASLNLGGDNANASSSYSVYRIWLAKLSRVCRTRTRTDDALKQEMIDIIEEVRKRGLFKTRKPEGKAGEH
ncbi:hypothetical protein EST38_g5073, partial [Candolleomyces aberdarensis]